MSFKTVLSFTLWMMVVVAPGCAVSPIYQEGTLPGLAVLPKKSDWRAVGSLQDIRYAIDGDINTAALNGAAAEEATITIDLGRACMFNTVVIDHGRNEPAYAHSVAVLISMDGKNFTQRYSAPGTRRVSTFCMPSPVLARYVRIAALAPRAGSWSVAEVYLQ